MKARVRRENAHVHLAMRVNGEETEVSFAPYKTLLEVVREDMGLMGTKHGCELGECGACAVVLDGEPVLSCLVLGLECEGRDVLTIEGIDTEGRLHPLQETFADLGAAQCGYCTPGILLTAKSLLERNPSPSRDQIKEALSGNLCRCTGYLQIFEAVEEAIVRIGADAQASVRKDSPSWGTGGKRAVPGGVAVPSGPDRPAGLSAERRKRKSGGIERRDNR